MAEKSGGFTGMAASGGDMEGLPRVGIGMLGYAFMGKAHSNAWKKLPYMMYPPPALPVLRAICGRNADAVRAAAERYGYERYYTEWQALVEDEGVQIFDNAGPNHLHAAPTVAAARAGKHVFCEKPLARNASEAYEMWQAVEKAGVRGMVCFNYRFVPAIRLMKELIDSGKLGRIYHYRAVYHQEWIMPHYGTPMIWRLEKDTAGSGALGDLGAHIVDLAHYLIGGVRSVSALAKTFIPERPRGDGSTGTVSVDDAFVAAVEFENGAIGSLEATRFAAGRKNYEVIEINGEKGSLHFNLERLNELQVYWVDDDHPETQGFRNVLVNEPGHPFMSNWWPQGHIIGWEHTFVHACHHLLDAVINGSYIAPHGATFEDGYRAAVVCDAVLESAASRRQVDVGYGGYFKSNPKSKREAA